MTVQAEGKEIYDRVRRLLDDDSDLTHEEMMALLARSAEANGQNEPGMEDSDQLVREGEDDLRPLATARLIRETMAEEDANDPARGLYQHVRRNP